MRERERGRGQVTQHTATARGSTPPPPPSPLSLSGLDAVRGSARVYLEAYTSILMVGKEKLVREERGGGDVFFF